MPQSKRKRIHRSRAEWSRLLTEYETGDKTQRDFCANRGLTHSNFCRWRNRIRTEVPDDAGAEAEPVSVSINPVRGTLLRGSLFLYIFCLVT